MPILSFQQFQVNEDQTANLIQQKNSLSQQINDLQKKLLDVQQQIVVAQKQTLAQNPQSQIPMQEALEQGFLPTGAKIEMADYYPSPREEDKGELYIRFSVTGQKEHGEIEADVDDFQEFVVKHAHDIYDRNELKRYIRQDYDGDSHQSYFAFDDFWNETEQKEKNLLIQDYLKKNGAIA